MRLAPSLGKVPRDFLESVIFKNLGRSSRSVLVRPGHGFDNAVLSVDDKKVMILTADPLSIIPSLGMKDSAWLSVHLLASDLTTSGATPQFAVLDFNLPPDLDLGDFGVYERELSEECKRLGISIVGGHTGRYPGCGLTVVGGGVLLSMVDRSQYVTPGMAQPGDVLVATKGAAIASTAVLAHTFPHRIEEGAGKAALLKAKSYLHRCSTVKDARAAAAIGLREGVTSMHDATEGGVLGGLYELASACGKAIVIDTDKIFVSRETRSVCSIFGLDPLVSLSEGTLIITCKKKLVENLEASLARSGIRSCAIGEVRDSKSGLWASTKGSKARPLVPPKSDPYWDAYSRAVELGWN